MELVSQPVGLNSAPVCDQNTILIHKKVAIFKMTPKTGSMIYL